MARAPERKLEITQKLEELAVAGVLDNSIAILNLPAANLCEKRAERVSVGGRSWQACYGCVSQGIPSGDALDIDEIKGIIDFFAEQYGTKFITINGRGDPFHPQLRSDTLEKVRYAQDRWGIQSYVFTAGNNLDERTCETLSDHRANVMMSLFGNRFIDAEFFSGKVYQPSAKPLQDQLRIATNFRQLISTYAANSNQPAEGTTRLGMNYVVSRSDLRPTKLRKLKHAANANGIFFVSNMPFQPIPLHHTQHALECLASHYSDFELRHSTEVNGQCQMGAGSSATVDFDGTLLRCPYMDSSQGDGKFRDLIFSGMIQNVLRRYIADRSFPCVMRKHQR